MRIRIIPLTTGIVVTLLFIAFTFIVRSDALRQFDFNITVKIQDRLPDKAYEYLNLIATPAGFEVMTGLLILILAITRKWIRLAISLGVYGGAHVLELIGKMILSQPPPQFMFYKLPTSAWFPDNYQPEGNSYPSGHSFRAFFFAVLMSSLILTNKSLPKIIRYGLVYVLLCFAATVAVAKIALGQHWATDVIAGAIIGIGSSLVAAGITDQDRLSSRYKSGNELHLADRP